LAPIQIETGSQAFLIGMAIILGTLQVEIK